VAQQYLPAGLQGRIFYKPGNQGYEEVIGSSVDPRRELQLEAALEGTGGSDEVLTFSPPDKRKEGWLKRTAEAQAGNLRLLREKMFEDITIHRHHRILVCSGGSGFLVWEALRRVPEGGVFYLPRNAQKGEILEGIAAQIHKTEGPQILKELPLPGLGESGDLRFEHILSRQDVGHRKNRTAWLEKLSGLIVPQGSLSLSEIIPRGSTRLSSLLGSSFPPSFLKAMEQAESALFDDPSRPITGWTEEILEKEVEEGGFQILKKEIIPHVETVRLTTNDIQAWIAPRSAYGQELVQILAKDEITPFSDALIKALGEKEVPWERVILRFLAKDHRS